MIESLPHLNYLTILR